jgi:hypothetical protein
LGKKFFLIKILKLKKDREGHSQEELKKKIERIKIKLEDAGWAMERN